MALQSEHFRGVPRIEAAARNNPPLKSGQQGGAVERLQSALIALDYPLPISTKKTGLPDGIYGSETRGQVVKFQGNQKPKLSTDGQAGENTLAAMDALLVSRGAKYPASKGDDVDVFKTIRIKGEPEPAGIPPWVDWSPAGYRSRVRQQAEKVFANSRVGRAVLNAIKGYVLIKPAPHARVGNALFIPSERSIRYIPGNFIPDSPLNTNHPSFVGMTADAVLLHEMVHAMRFTTGFRVADKEEISAIRYPPGLPPTHNPKAHLFFSNRAEFNAIVVSNTYRAEIQPNLALGGMAREILLLVRDHHAGHIHLRLPAPEKFHLHNKIKHYLKMFWREQPEFCAQIAAVPAKFNPLRDVDRS